MKFAVKLIWVIYTLNKIINILFPPKCIFCGKILSVSTRVEICGECYANIPFINEENLILVNKKLPDGISYDGIICVCEYSGIVRSSLIRYKFSEKPGYYRAFAKLLSERVKRMTNYNYFDIILSVPLHKKKRSKRGYNQSQLISRQLAKEIGVCERSQLLVRVKNTDSQSLLSKNERSQNIKSAFKVTDKEKIKGKVILLVDDIFTTGSTVNECSKVLKEAGAKAVFAAVIATGRKV